MSPFDRVVCGEYNGIYIFFIILILIKKHFYQILQYTHFDKFVAIIIIIIL